MRQYIEAVKAESHHFVHHDSINKKQAKALERVIDLFQRPEATEQQGATKSRRTAAKNLLMSILSILGREVFFLCVFAIPITRLATIKQRDDFVKALREWWTTSKKPEALVLLSSRLRENISRIEALCDTGQSLLSSILTHADMNSFGIFYCATETTSNGNANFD